jgi:hypothetical protein
MNKLNRQTMSWSLTERPNNVNRSWIHQRPTGITLDRIWDQPGEVAWVNITIKRADGQVQLPPADLDELIELLQNVRSEITSDELVGPEQIRKYNDQVRIEKREQARARSGQESDQCA